MTSYITSWQLPMAEGWGGFRTAGLADAADRVADELAENDAAADRVRAMVLTFENTFSLPDHAYVGGAVWVPDPTTGDTYGALTVQLLERRRSDAPGLATADELHEELLHRRRPRGRKIFRRDVRRVDLDAGPAVVDVEIHAHRFLRGEVTTSAAWHVLPGDSVYGVGLEFTTLLPALGDALIETAAETVQGLRVKLEPLPEEFADA